MTETYNTTGDRGILSLFQAIQWYYSKQCIIMYLRIHLAVTSDVSGNGNCLSGLDLFRKYVGIPE